MQKIHDAVAKHDNQVEENTRVKVKSLILRTVIQQNLYQEENCIYQVIIFPM